MVKSKAPKRNGRGPGPYAMPLSTNVAKNIFKMNKDIGQHILKNPGICQAMVDKADLKQSDVRFPV